MKPIIPVHLKVTQSALSHGLLFLIRDLDRCVSLCRCERELPACVWRVLVFCKAIDVRGTQLCVG